MAITSERPARGPAGLGRALPSVAVGLVALLFAAVLPPVAIPLGALAILLGASAYAELRRSAPAGRRVAYAGLLLGALAIAAAVGIAIAALSSV